MLYDIYTTISAILGLGIAVFIPTAFVVAIVLTLKNKVDDHYYDKYNKGSK